jgi:ribosomal protein S18 acetylase RimI-like enzyme
VDFLLILLVLAVAVAIVAWPLRQARARPETEESAELAALEAAKEAKYREIRDAELDYRTGKLSEADYRALDATLRAEAIELLRRTDALAPAGGVELRPVDAESRDARRLLDAFAEEISARYPGWTPSAPPHSTPRDFAAPHGRFVVAYRDGRAVACGGVRRIEDEAGEIKRLYVAPGARGQGLARRVLDDLEVAARELGCSRVRLDTGARQPEALALFRAAGYAEIADYNGNPFAAHWFEKGLP